MEVTKPPVLDIGALQKNSAGFKKQLTLLNTMLKIQNEQLEHQPSLNSEEYEAYTKQHTDLQKLVKEICQLINPIDECRNAHERQGILLQQRRQSGEYVPLREGTHRTETNSGIDLQTLSAAIQESETHDVKDSEAVSGPFVSIHESVTASDHPLIPSIVVEDSTEHVTIDEAESTAVVLRPGATRIGVDSGIDSQTLPAVFQDEAETNNDIKDSELTVPPSVGNISRSPRLEYPSAVVVDRNIHGDPAIYPADDSVLSVDADDVEENVRF